MYNARVTLKEQIAAGLVKSSLVRYDWDLKALAAALPGPRYIHRKKIQLRPKTVERLIEAEELSLQKPLWDVPIELAEYWRLRDAGKVSNTPQWKSILKQHGAKIAIGACVLALIYFRYARGPDTLSASAEAQRARILMCHAEQKYFYF